MGKITITQFGRESIRDFVMLRKYILVLLSERNSLDVYDLVLYIRTSHLEYKHTKLQIIIETLMEMSKQQLITIEMRGW